MNVNRMLNILLKRMHDSVTSVDGQVSRRVQLWSAYPRSMSTNVSGVMKSFVAVQQSAGDVTHIYLSLDHPAVTEGVRCSCCSCCRCCRSCRSCSSSSCCGGEIWLLVVVFGCWLLLVVVGCCWLLLVVIGCCWLFLIIIGCYSLLLVVIGCCSLLFVFARFCVIVCAFVVVFVRRVCLRSPCRRHFPTPGAALLFPILGMHPQRMRGVGTVGEWQLLFVLFKVSY